LSIPQQGRTMLTEGPAAGAGKAARRGLARAIAMPMLSTLSTINIRQRRAAP
jgi:hypothetical protein